MTDERQETTREVSREEAQQLVTDGAQLIDVRADHEWDAGRIPGATHLPLADLDERTGELDPGRPLILYCRGGTRSSMATEVLATAGYDAAKLTEGIVGWEAAGLPLEPKGGYAAESGEAAAILEARKKGAES